MKRFVTTFLTLLLTIPLASCGEKSTEIEKNDNYNDVVKLQANDSFDEHSEPYWSQHVHDLVAVENGYYYITNDFFIKFYDNNLKSSYKVCGKADCDHENGNCDAFVGNKRNYDR